MHQKSCKNQLKGAVPLNIKRENHFPHSGYRKYVTERLHLTLTADSFGASDRVFLDSIRIKFFQSPKNTSDQTHKRLAEYGNRVLSLPRSRVRLTTWAAEFSAFVF